MRSHNPQFICTTRNWIKLLDLFETLKLRYPATNAFDSYDDAFLKNGRDFRLEQVAHLARSVEKKNGW